MLMNSHLKLIIGIYWARSYHFFRRVVRFPGTPECRKDCPSVDGLAAQLATNDRARPRKIKVHAVEKNILEQLGGQSL